MSDRSQDGIPDPPWVEAVLDFWFAELTEDEWFGKDDALDARIRSRFLPLHGQLAQHNGLGVATPRAILAAVIVLDQFSRNMYRGDARAFAGDAIARRLAKTAVDQGFDVAMTIEQRYFLYLPFEHGERLDDQVLALKLIGQLGHANWTEYAIAHKVLIDRFGRFPHRNQVLNRPSTPDEIAHLAESTTTF